jgi:plasmid stabilization system protein ParE/Arc/MetJ-type ribon-helix-helix transcriptional regulator
MTINLTPEQERRLQAVLSRGAYASVEAVVDAALAAVEQHILAGFAGMPDELDALLVEGLASKEGTDTDFWDSVNKRTDILLAEHKTGLRPWRFFIGKPLPTMLFASFGIPIDQNLPQIADRFKDAVRQHPRVGARYRWSAPQLHNLRSGPVAAFEAIRIYYLLDREAIHVIRVRHGKRDLKRILERERTV